MRKALVVGINHYPTNPLAGCINDANELEALLERHADDSPNFTVRKILSGEDHITRGTLKRAIADLFSDEPDTALFYFSGHGFLNPFGGYIVTPDYESYDEGVSMEDILKAANGSKAKSRIVLLDCCHAGAMGSPAIREGCVSVLADGVTVLAACRSDESASESGKQGVFTALLLDALRGGSADLLGQVSPGGVYAYVDRALGPWQQRPVFKTNVSRFVSLRDVKPSIERPVLRKICSYFPNPEEEYQLDPSYEFTEESQDPDKVLIFKDLQKMERVGLVVPVGEEYMYFAAINSKSCRLTAMGVQYWTLANSGRI